MALVIGGGNLMRGREAKSVGVSPLMADRMGMLATVMNAVALASLLRDAGAPARVMTALPMGSLAEPWTPEAARAALAAGEIVLAAGGIGQPFFSTDTTAALRAVELGADVLLKATQVDGVYTADPKVDPGAERLPSLTFDEVLRRELRIMDAAAFALCREHGLPVRIFEFGESGSLRRIMLGEDLGSEVTTGGSQ
jgi:uridylate kinase